MKNLLLFGTLSFAATTVAHNNHIEINTKECAVTFQNDVRITADELAISSMQDKALLITDSGELYIDEKHIQLTKAQKADVIAYANSLREQLPKVADIAIEGVKIAGVALNEVSTAFNLNGFEPLNTMMDELHLEISESFYQQDAFVLGEKSFNDFGIHFEETFESHIEDAIEGAMLQSIGGILMALGSEMVNSKGDIDSFEQRMEKMGQQIETNVEKHVQHIEHQANRLCGQFEKIADSEADLIAQIPAMEDYQLFTLN